MCWISCEKQKFLVRQFSQSWCICCRGRKENKLGKYLQNNKWEDIFKWKYLHPVFAEKFMYLSPFVDNKMISGGGVLRLWQSATCWWGGKNYFRNFYTKYCFDSCGKYYINADIFQADISANKSLCGNLDSQVISSNAMMRWFTVMMLTDDIMILNSEPWWWFWL